MRLYIPDIGDSIVLTEDWSFPLHDERRNDPLLAIVEPDFKERRFANWRLRNFDASYSCVLPAGTQLIIARVYIRNGASEYSSITFRVGECPNKALRKKRFWAKLSDVNRINCEK